MLHVTLLELLVTRECQLKGPLVSVSWVQEWTRISEIGVIIVRDRNRIRRI
jgi:hypothetical protein